MIIWIDNDGCPRIVRDIVYKNAARCKVAVRVVGNSFMHVPPGGGVQMIKVDGGFDKADDYIAENVGRGDLVITADVPLAARVVEKGAIGLSNRGEVFDSRNIADKLSTRNLMQELRSGGTVSGGPPPFGDAEKRNFANALDRLVSKLVAAAPAAAPQ